MIKIYSINKDKFNDLVNKWVNKERIDNKLFISKDDKQYLCLDNESGDCFVESFETKDQALCWLIRSDYGALEIENLKRNQIQKLLRNHKYRIIEDISELVHEI